ncbi:MAG: ABC transporter ATP-binding protein [Acidobacteria bacterium]|nr:ABC transporter ATP-binding protein [Acidobacteriota bacterium]
MVDVAPPASIGSDGVVTGPGAGKAEVAHAKLGVAGVEIQFEIGKHAHLAVAETSFSVADGEKLILLGPSGCGKSTLLKAIGGFIRPSRGEILLDGIPVREPGPDRMLIFQEFGQLFPWKTIEGNIVHALRAVRGCSAGEARDIAARHLEMVGLLPDRHFYPHTISGGMKQRVAIARALAVDPAVLLMDEPFGALDAQTREVLQRELNQLWAKTRKTIVFVTHAIDEAVRLGERIIVLTAGPGRIKAVFANPCAESYLADFEGDPAGAAELRKEIRGLLEQRPARGIGG